MTQAFNLSQLANNINTSGQLDATDGLTGAVPLTNGGTGTTNTVNSIVAGTGISTSVSGTQVTINSTVTGGVSSLNGQTGAITNTSLYAIGSYITGRPENTTNYAVNSTIAGSSLYACCPSGAWDSSSGAPWLVPALGAGSGAGQTLVNTGTWRCMSTAFSSGTYGLSGLWVRIS